MHSIGHVVRNQGGNANAEVDEHAFAQLAGDALGDNGLGVHCVSER
jgi:hypothetical protein